MSDNNKQRGQVVATIVSGGKFVMEMECFPTTLPRNKKGQIPLVLQSDYQTLEAERDQLQREGTDLTDFLIRSGYQRCNISACNCGSWHQTGGLRQRFEEIKDALGEAGHPLSNSNGNIALNALEELVQERDALQATLAANNATAPAQPQEPIEFNGIAEAIAGGDGFWRSCSGCHELNEGHDTGSYSTVFKCALGNGCSECGGIGAVWDTTDYGEMAEAMLAADNATTPAQPQISNDTVYAVSKALREAWQLGQAYWKQAASHSWTQQDKAPATRDKFDALIKETRALLQEGGK